MLNASRTSTRTPFDQPGDTLPRSPSSSHYPCIAPPTPRVTLAPNLEPAPSTPAAHRSSLVFFARVSPTLDSPIAAASPSFGRRNTSDH